MAQIEEAAAPHPNLEVEAPYPYPYPYVAYESDHRVRDSLVRMLVKHKIVGFANLENAERGVGDDTLLDGHLLIAFHGLHALVLILPDKPAFKDFEPYTDLIKGEYADVTLVGASYVHLTFKNKEPVGDETDSDYVIEWQDINAAHMNLGFYQRVFYVCDLDKNVSMLDLEQTAIAVKAEFYSTFYSDCLEYCKLYVKKCLCIGGFTVRSFGARFASKLPSALY